MAGFYFAASAVVQAAGERNAGVKISSPLISFTRRACFSCSLSDMIRKLLRKI